MAWRADDVSSGGRFSAAQPNTNLCTAHATRRASAGHDPVYSRYYQGDDRMWYGVRELCGKPGSVDAERRYVLHQSARLKVPTFDFDLSVNRPGLFGCWREKGKIRTSDVLKSEGETQRGVSRVGATGLALTDNPVAGQCWMVRGIEGTRGRRDQSACGRRLSVRHRPDMAPMPSWVDLDGKLNCSCMQRRWA